MHFAVSIAVAIGCALLPWGATRVPTRWAAGAAVPLLVVIVVGAIVGLPLYPLSDVIVGGFAVLAGIVLGRAMPARFRPLLVLLLVLSVLDVVQNIAFSGGPSTAAPSSSTAPDPHLVWLNFRIPLPGGHFNVGFADLILIAAISENLRRRGATLALSVLPGIIGVGLGEALVATLPPAPPSVAIAVSESLVPFLTLGYALAELAVGQLDSGARR